MVLDRQDRGSGWFSLQPSSTPATLVSGVRPNDPFEDLGKLITPSRVGIFWIFGISGDFLPGRIRAQINARCVECQNSEKCIINRPDQSIFLLGGQSWYPHGASWVALYVFYRRLPSMLPCFPWVAQGLYFFLSEN
jgi:hypothetical protein